VYYGDADGKVEECIPVREVEDIGHHCCMGLMLDCYLGQVFGSAGLVLVWDADSRGLPSHGNHGSGLCVDEKDEENPSEKSTIKKQQKKTRHKNHIYEFTNSLVYLWKQRVTNNHKL
jgi:hypothetical protein